MRSVDLRSDRIGTELIDIGRAICDSRTKNSRYARSLLHTVRARNGVDSDRREWREGASPARLENAGHMHYGSATEHRRTPRRQLADHLSTDSSTRLAPRRSLESRCTSPQTATHID